MAHRFVCPDCGKGLRVPEGCTDAWLTCPHCLVELTNPATGSAAAIRAEPPGPHAAVQTGPLSAREARSPRPSPEVDVRRDRRHTGVALVVLAVLGGLGVAHMLLIVVAGLSEGTAWPLVIVTAVVAGVAAIVAVRVYHGPQPPTGAPGVGRVLVKTLTVFGVVYGVFLLLALAAVVFLFIVCFSGGMKF